MNIFSMNDSSSLKKSLKDGNNLDRRSNKSNHDFICFQGSYTCYDVMSRGMTTAKNLLRNLAIIYRETYIYVYTETNKDLIQPCKIHATIFKDIKCYFSHFLFST